MSLKMIQDHVDPSLFCRNPFFCSVWAIYQKFQISIFDLSFENLDTDCYITMDIRENSQNLPE